MKQLSISHAFLVCVLIFLFGCDAGVKGRHPKSSTEIKWQLKYHETFDKAFKEPSKWVEDHYGEKGKYHVGPFDDDGNYFLHARGDKFTEELSSFRSFRKSFTYGQDDWLTVELYGRDSDKDGVPETGGKFISVNGKAKLISTRHWDGAIIRPTKALPSRYRVEVTVSNINFGGKINGSWEHGDKVNGYDGDEAANPWLDYNAAYRENGVYFLCITDYSRPAPHNNVFIHHHRKVVMDTDNNMEQWSKVWNPKTEKLETDGSRYISMIWLNGDDFGHDKVGNDFISYTPGGWQTKEIGFVDKYLPGETYVFTIERDGKSYAMSVSGNFFYGGKTRYFARREFNDSPKIWHYNQTPQEYQPPFSDQEKSYFGQSFYVWPKNSSYPDFFFFGDPHINFYEGTAEYDDLKLFLPANG